MLHGQGGRGRVGARGASVVLFLAAFLLSSAVLMGLSGSSEAESAYTGGGYLSPRTSSADDSIWRYGSGNSPDNTTVSLTISGAGTKGITLAPQDVVFIMDHSGSLQTYDPQVMRILGAHRYVESMIAPFDRAAVIKFDSAAGMVNNDHLSSNYPQVHADLEVLERTQPQGQTNFKAAMDVVISEFSTFGNSENQRIAVLFTDGITESINNAGEMFGEDRVRTVIRRNSREPAGKILTEILDAVEQFTLGQPQFDDITLMVIKGT